MHERLPEEIPPILAQCSIPQIDLFNLDNRRIHQLADDIGRDTGKRVRPYDLWHYFSISMHGIASDRNGKGRRSNYERQYGETFALLSQELGREPAPCEIFRRIYDDSLAKFFAREAREMAREYS